MNFKLVPHLLFALLLWACHKTEQPQPTPPADPLIGKWEEVDIIASTVFGGSKLSAEFFESGDFRHHFHHWSDCNCLCGQFEDDNFVLGKFSRDSAYLTLQGEFVDSTFSVAQATCQGRKFFDFKLAYRINQDTLLFPYFTMQNGKWEPPRKLYRAQ